MLTVVKNQIKVNLLTLKYAIMREMINKITFFSNIIFMILNNSCMIVQWVVLFSIKSDMGGYTFRDVLLLWGLAAGTYGVSHFFFKRCFNLSETINNGSLDNYIIQPKNILLSAITSDVEVSALGDMVFAIIVYFIYGFTIRGFILFILFSITGGLMITAISVILNSLSFWFNNADMIAESGNGLMTNFATYPDGIFKGITKWLLFTIIPVGIVNYIPIKAIIAFNPTLLLINVVGCIILVTLAFLVFYLGLKRYSSTNLMNARI